MRRLVCPALVLAVLILAAPSAHAGTLAFGQLSCSGEPACLRDCLPACLSLWIADEDGTELRRLPAVAPFYPTWSRDGSRIAYQYGRGLRLTSADGMVDQAILDPGESYAGAPAWSPREDLIAFPYEDHSAPASGGGQFGSLYTSDIYVIRPDGSGLRKVAGGPGNEDSVRFTADGRRLEYYRNSNPFQPDGKGNGNYSIALDGTGERLLTLGAGVYLPTASPDGKRLAFIRDGVVWLVDATGADPEPLTARGTNADGPLRWSSDGSRLYFLYTTEASPPFTERTVYVADMKQAHPVVTPVLPGKRLVLFFDWTGPPAKRRTADDTPPGVILLDTRGVPRPAAAAHRSATVLSKRRTRLFGFDMTGIRSVQLAVARRDRAHRGVRCRFMGKARFGRPRSCARPTFTTLQSGAAFSERIGRLPAGSYLLGFRTKDVLGNSDPSPRLHRVTLRP